MEHYTDEQWSQRLREHAKFDRSCDLNCDLSERPDTASEALNYAAEYGSIYCLNVALQYCGADFYNIERALTQAARNDDMHAVETLLQYAASELYSSEALQAACINKNSDMVECLWGRSDCTDAVGVLNQYMPNAAQFLQDIIDHKQAQQQKNILDAAVGVWKETTSLKRKM